MPRRPHRTAVPPLRLAAVAVLLAVAPLGANAGKDTHEYADEEEVTVWTDKVGPYNNPQETYKYPSLGLCEMEGNDIEVAAGEVSIGESLEGHEFYSSPRVRLAFGKTTPTSKVCDMKLTAEKAQALSAMIHENYWYQLYLDDLPIWAFVGEHSKFGLDVSRFSGLLRENNRTRVGTPQPQSSAPPLPAHLKGKPLPRVYTHRHFTLLRNGNQLIEVDMEPSSPWPVYDGAPLNFTYSAAWYTTGKAFKDRTMRYLDPKFFEHKVHWFSIVNSLMMCLFLCAVVGIILMKTLKKDFARLAASDEAANDGYDTGDDSGWKQISGDVFRPPSNLAAFSVVYATGCHVIFTVFIVLIFSMLNSYYAQRGATAGAFVISYLVTVIAGGYEGGRIYSLYGGQHWKRAMIQQAAFLPSLVFTSFVVINTTAVVYRSTMTVPFKTVFIVIVLFFLLCMPLHAAGTLLGRRTAADQSFPGRCHHLKRPIPTKHWLFSPAMVLAAGLVPFGCLFIEMYFILSAVWSHNKIYYVYGFMFAIMCLLCLVIVNVSITCTYVLLNAEDWRWPWQSFMCCSATSVYVFAYTVHYYFYSTQMTGILQTVYYFGTSINFCIGLALFCGSLGYYGSLKFCCLIYSNIKAE